MRAFDRKFGEGLIDSLPRAPAVYLFKAADDSVLYVGKAKDIRRRLSDYRNASRRKVHRKMRTLVRDAVGLEIRLQPSERAALALESRLIRILSPPHNVDGTHSFLYPAIGLARTQRHTLLCFTTQFGAWDGFGFTWHGVFRSRLRARDAFDGLVDVLCLVGHREKAARLGAPRVRGSRLVGIRRLDAAVVDGVGAYLTGQGPRALAPLTRALLDKPRARREAGEVQAALDGLAGFHRTDLAPLRDALHQANREGHFVSQDERDLLFIETRD